MGKWLRERNPGVKRCGTSSLLIFMFIVHTHYNRLSSTACYPSTYSASVVQAPLSADGKNDSITSEWCSVLQKATRGSGSSE